ncbi:MAG: hypothetical protein AAFU71_08425 [Cyanobacteria bacterium J06632_22]
MLHPQIMRASPDIAMRQPFMLLSSPVDCEYTSIIKHFSSGVLFGASAVEFGVSAVKNIPRVAGSNGVTNMGKIIGL